MDIRSDSSRLLAVPNNSGPLCNLETPIWAIGAPRPQNHASTNIGRLDGAAPGHVKLLSISSWTLGWGWSAGNTKH